MKLDFSSQKVFTLITITIICLMVSIFFWRISVAEQQLQLNIDDRVKSAGNRIANSVLPIVYNIYQKSTERHFTEETTSAILDSELNENFLLGIKVYGNFGHLFMGKYKTQQNKLINLNDTKIPPAALDKLKSIRTPVKQGTMTIGNVEIYYSYDTQQPLLDKIIIRELLQIGAFTLFILLSFYLVKKMSSAKSSAEKALIALENAQLQLIESEKLASLGALVAGVAHEVNTPLGNAITSNDFVLEKSKEISKAIAENSLSKHKLQLFLIELNDALLISENSLERVVDLLGTFKKVAADQMIGDVQKIELVAYINEIMKTLSTEMRKNNVTYTVNFKKEFHIKTVPGELAQVLINLVNNSIKHGFEEKENGTITIDIVEQTNNKISIVYRDDGQGMNEHVLQNIYEPFFTTKRNKGGIGLGMNIVYNIIKKNLQGDIAVISKLNSGVTFTITLPKTVEHKTINKYTHST